MESNFGIKQFSPFGSWKKLNNALYMYANTYRRNDGSIPPQYLKLDSTIVTYFNTTHRKVSLYEADFSSGSYYIFRNSPPNEMSPLLKYMHDIYGPDNEWINFKKMAPLGQLYDGYATYLVKKYPSEYIKYVIIPNAFRYFYPQTEIFTNEGSPYDLRNDSLGNIAKRWFNLKTLASKTDFIKARTVVFSYYPIIFTVVHILFFINILTFLIVPLFRSYIGENIKIVTVIGLLGICNFLFSITVGSSLIRYEAFIITIEIGFLSLPIQFLMSKET